MSTPANRPRRRTVAGAAALAAATMVGGCGLGTAGGFSPTGKLAGPVAGVPSLNGATISVGSKNFTEQILLGKIMVILLQSAGADVQDLTNVPGSASSRQAMEAGQIDAAWEYTGTAWISYLGQTDAIPDEKKQFEAVRDLDARENNLIWLKPAPMNNTYAFATTAATAQKLGVKTLSELKSVPKDQLTFCVDSEFANRNDGFQPMLKKYGLTYGSDVTSAQVKILNEGAIYAATASGECTFGEVFTTDGRIKALNLSVLKDDKNYFPKYNASAVVRGEVLERNPQLRPLLEAVTDRLTDDKLIELNARVDVDGEEPVDVAHDFLRREGLIVDK